jgi:hypothetical protein
MQYFLESSNLDAATAELLQKYDKDSNGAFSKDEVVQIIVDLRREMQNNITLGEANRILKKAIGAAVVFCLILMSSMFGLAYAVATLTSKLDVDSSTGVMTTPDGAHVVATDSVSHKIVTIRNTASGAQCLDSSELGQVVERVLNGNSVILEMLGTGVNGTDVEIQKLWGSVHLGDGQLCFMGANGQEVCAEPSAECDEVSSSGRRLDTAASIQNCLATGAQYSSAPWVFGSMVSPGAICIRSTCPGDVIWDNPQMYAVTYCVCKCAVENGAAFSFSFGTR